MNTREVADKLFAYADLLDAETSRLHAKWRVTGEDHDCEAHNRYQFEASEVRVMANELREMKEKL